MSMEIGGEDHEISPAVWNVFDDWYGDKAYRKVDFVARFEAAVRAQAAEDLRTKAASDWPGIGLLLEDIIAVVERGANGEPSEG
ncbi:hypothetical protein [Streptomyces sp. NPDC091212]|uniref:hypothetical protein n=1 Tax=Streptomyces sp. NPDC091212 TaxID=3155191 RepID=UPI003426C786